MSAKQSSERRELISWTLSLLAGVIFGILSLQLPLTLTTPVPVWLTFPFIALLLSIAIIPLINAHWWHHNYPNVSLFLGGLIASIYALGYELGPHKLYHTTYEYFSFLALVGGLFFVASCVKLNIQGIGSAKVNTALLAFGAVISNLLGTTGASLLLIRPFIKINQNRIRPLHIVFFIIIVSNCGGALTPIGDPPLYLGFIKGIPFTWTINNLFSSWLFVNSLLLLIYFLFDHFGTKSSFELSASQKFKVTIEGKTGIISLLLMVVAIFIDPIFNNYLNIQGLPLTALTQVIIAFICFKKTEKQIKIQNEFTIEPFKEVSLIFAGIFATMIPALDYLSSHGQSLGIIDPKTFFYGTGLLSAFLDNAPTYLNFLQVAIGPNEISRNSLTALYSDPTGNLILIAISTGAVFFGALTYIGNGPNFMVKSIAQSVGLKTPSFFSYFTFALLILGPILLLHSYFFL